VTTKKYFFCSAGRRRKSFGPDLNQSEESIEQ